jgi:glutamate/tyrosine decarboxylase-like PLP-dependent enzyme
MNKNDLRQKPGSIDISAKQFREIGHKLIDDIAELLSTMSDRQVSTEISPGRMKEILNSAASVPENGSDAKEIVDDFYKIFRSYSLYNGHPRFWGYITSSPAPIGALGDLLAAAVNPNVGAWKLSPVATELESQTVRWIAEMMGYPHDCGGLLVSGGNMANYVGFLAARRAMVDYDVRKTGLSAPSTRQLLVYASDQVHTWLEKAADIFGLGTDSIRRVKADRNQRMIPDELRRILKNDMKNNFQPMLLVGTAGTVSTGAIDPLGEIANICREHGIWFHVDGAYGGFAAAIENPPEEILGLREADSVAVDPHKWLYAPLEAGCALVRDPQNLLNAFTYHPPYYHFGEEAVNFVDFGPQNSRGFRALKVWLSLKQIGRKGYQKSIQEDIRLSEYMREVLDNRDEFETFTHSLSIVTFRYIPRGLKAQSGDDSLEKYLNELNEKLLDCLNDSGELFISNAVIDGRFLLRACIVNFRTCASDVEAMPEIIARHGRELDRLIRPDNLK